MHKNDIKATQNYIKMTLLILPKKRFLQFCYKCLAKDNGVKKYQTCL